jgi:hypothetical protein
MQFKVVSKSRVRKHRCCRGSALGTASVAEEAGNRSPLRSVVSLMLVTCLTELRRDLPSAGELADGACPKPSSKDACNRRTRGGMTRKTLRVVTCTYVLRVLRLQGMLLRSDLRKLVMVCSTVRMGERGRWGRELRAPGPCRRCMQDFWNSVGRTYLNFR